MSNSRGDDSTRAIGMFAVAVGAAWIGSVWIVLAVAVGVISVACGVHAWTPAREASARYRVRRRRDLKLQGCITRLKSEGVPEERVRALTALGFHIGRLNDEHVEKFPIDDLLDGYTDLECERHHCLLAMANVTRNELVAELALPARGDALDEQRRASVALRLRTWDECHEQALQCERQIATISAIIRAIQLRAAVPARTLRLDAVDRALEDLETDAAALAEVKLLEPPQLPKAA